MPTPVPISSDQRKMSSTIGPMPPFAITPQFLRLNASRKRLCRPSVTTCRTPSNSSRLRAVPPPGGVLWFASVRIDSSKLRVVPIRYFHVSISA